MWTFWHRDHFCRSFFLKFFPLYEYLHGAFPWASEHQPGLPAQMKCWTQQVLSCTWTWWRWSGRHSLLLAIATDPSNGPSITPCLSPAGDFPNPSVKASSEIHRKGEGAIALGPAAMCLQELSMCLLPLEAVGTATTFTQLPALFCCGFRIPTPELVYWGHERWVRTWPLCHNKFASLASSCP